MVSKLANWALSAKYTALENHLKKPRYTVAKREKQISMLHGERTKLDQETEVWLNMLIIPMYT
jgi:hypothetical protein